MMTILNELKKIERKKLIFFKENQSIIIDQSITTKKKITENRIHTK